MKNIAVIFGSRSAEHDVSIITAYSSIIEPLKLSDNLLPIPIYISKSGKWYSDKTLKTVDFFTESDTDLRLKKLRPIALSFDGGLFIIEKNGKGRRTKIDVVFPATHGTYGEDGSLMGLLRMANVPFVGCDIEASVIAMDKGLTKIAIEAAGLLSNKYYVFSDEEFSENESVIEKELSKLEFPLFVKPVHLGSSIAITRVKTKLELENAIELAFHYDNKIIVEEAVKNLIEVTVPIIGNETLHVALVEEALNKGADFFDFETKYLQGGKKGKAGVGAKSGGDQYSRLPAKIDTKLYKKCEDVAKRAYRAIGASGIARVDLLIDKKLGAVYVNEINPLPGSLYVHNWKQAGISNVDLVTKLIEYAQERYIKNNNLVTKFDTSFLSQF